MSMKILLPFLTKSNKNSLSMVIEKVLENISNLVVLAVMARTLGPSIFGVFGLVQAAYGIGRPAATAVADQVLIQYQIKKGRDPSNLQKTALVIKYLMSIGVYMITFVFAYAYFDKETFYLVAIFGLMHFTSLDKVYFSYSRAQEDSFFVLLVKLSVVIPFSILKIGVILYSGDLFAVVVVYVLEAVVLSSLAYFLVQAKMRKEVGISRPFTNLRELAISSWPIFASATLVAAYTRVDQFMIDYYLLDEDLGYYTAAVKISLIIQYVLSAFLASRFPRLLKIRKKSVSNYEIEMVRLMRLCLFCGVSFTIFLFLFGGFVIRFIYGVSYAPASTVLVFSSMGTVFVFYGLLCTQWLLAADLQYLRIYRVLGGLIVNVLLNIWMIPAFGILGAAISTIVSQAFASVFFNYFHPLTRPVFWLQVYSLLPFFTEFKKEK